MFNLFRKNRNSDPEEENASGTFISREDDEAAWYDRHPHSIPAGCRACGGDYPDCKSGCPMFDDD